MAKAAAPSRASGTLTIGFGLVSVPVSVFSGIEDSGVKRQRYSKAGNPVGMQNFDKETGEVVEYGDLQMRYAADDGTLIELTDEEIAYAVGAENGRAEVVGFVPLTQLLRYQQESLMQVRPAAGANKKPSPAFQKAFMLLMTGMEKRKVFALVSYCLRGKPRVGALTPDGFLRQLAFDDEVREAIAMPSVALTKAETEMATKLIDTMLLPEAPVMDDEASSRIREYAETKAKSGQGVSIPEKKAIDEGEDLMKALEASIAAAQSA